MMRPDRAAGRMRLFLALLVMLAALGRGAGAPVTLPAAGPDRAEARLILALGGSICHDDTAGAAGHSIPPSVPHGLDCLLCPLCAATSAPTAILAAKAEIIAPGARRAPTLSASIPPRAPPSGTRHAAQPRAPPVPA